MGDSVYGWTFVSTLGGQFRGDQWSGVAVYDTGTFSVGQSFLSPRVTWTGKVDGYYVITSEERYAVDLSDHFGGPHLDDGAVFVLDHFDGASGSNSVPWLEAPTADGGFARIAAYTPDGLGHEGAFAVPSEGEHHFGWYDLDLIFGPSSLFG
jgi:hypothetical protein